jgi:hypothetical protein
LKPFWKRCYCEQGRDALATLEQAGDFKLQVKFEKPVEVFALCIICDGDHTQSKYHVTIKDIRLNPKNEKNMH